MLTGILVPVGGRRAGLRPRAGAAADAAGAADRRRLRPALQLWWDLPLRDSFALLRHVYARAGRRTPAGWRAAGRLLELDAFLDARSASSRSASGCAAS